MSWIVIIDPRAAKQLKRFPAKDYHKLREVINGLEGDPFFGDIEKLGGEENSWRRRVGNYRLFYQLYVEQRLVYIANIKRRTSNTY